MKKLFIFPALFLSAALFADDAAPARESNMFQTLIVLGIAILFFYFILWRPEQKRRKAMAEKRSAMKVGDRVTAMGIVGKISKINDDTLILEMVEGAKIEVLKAAVTDVTSA